MKKTNKNILIILNEDHGQWALGSYGNHEINTPTLDFLAKSGVQMDNAFTPTPVCSPSRACLLTGRLASQHGVHDYLDSQDPEVDNYPWLGDEITLPELLADAGYQIGLSGKWHLGRDNYPQANFNYWFTHSGAYPIEHGGRHQYSDQGELISLEGYKSQILTDKAISFLRERDTERPFFLLVSYTTSHSPWNNHPERLVNQYRQCDFDDIPDEKIYPFGIQNLESTFDTRLKPLESKAQYYASVSQVDEATGRIVDELEALGLRDSTLLIFTSDHGLNCGHHNIWGKGNGTLPLNMVEESIRIPLIFNQPGYLSQGQHRCEYVDHLDIFQTMVEYAGLELIDKGENYYPGRSFLPMLENVSSDTNWHNVQFGEYGNLRMIRTERYKLIHRYPDGPCELFDLQHDPREEVNLFDESEYQSLVNQLTHQIDEYFKRFEDPVKTGLNVKNLPRHNATEAWRTPDQ